MNDHAMPDPESAEVAEAVRCLLEGGIVLLPCDTVYALAVSPTHPASVDRLYALKDRPRTQNLPVMIGSPADLEAMGVVVTPSAERLFASPWIPGALTLALGFGAGPVPGWLAGRVEVAVRIPDDRRLLRILRETGPLLVTSANTHGLSTPETLPEVLLQIRGRPDLSIDGGAIGTTPSTLVNCRVDPPVLEREGVIPRSALLEFVHDLR